MGRQCALCGKKPKKAANRSHANNKTLRRQKPNLQKNSEKLLICSTCRRTSVKKNA